MPNSKPKSKGWIVNRVELAEIFGVALSTVDNWISSGCPVAADADRSRGVPYSLNTAEVAWWWHSERNV